MLKNYFKIAWRSLSKRRLFTFINLTGLVLGLSSFLLLFSFVASEWTYNDFHTNKDNIYRLVVTDGVNEPEVYLPPGYAAVLESQFTDIKTANILASQIAGGLVIIPETKESFKEDWVMYADGDFFRSFSFPVSSGNADLTQPNTVVISSKLAKKFFGNENGIGKTIQVSNQFGKSDYTVTGILEDITVRSDIKGEMFLSIHTLENAANRNGNDWADPNGMDSGFVNLYVTLKDGSDNKGLADQISQFIRQNPEAKDETVILQPLSEIHLGNSLTDPLPTQGSMGTVLVFAAIGLMIVGIAYVNYLNLSAANILTRIKEIRMRKVLGADSWQLAQQFMMETFMLMLLAFGLSFLIVNLIEVPYERLFGQPLWFGAFFQPVFWLVITAVLLLCTLLSGFYVVALSGKFGHQFQITFQPKSSQTLKKTLVILQFAISVTIIIGTIAIRDQLSFMQNQNLGMDLAQKLVIDGPSDLGENGASKVSAFKSSLRSQAFVEKLSTSNALPGIGYNFFASGITPMVPRPEDKDKSYGMMIMDEEFIDTYGMKLVAGRNFSPEEANQGWSQSKKLMLNENAALEFGFESAEAAVGQSILWGEPYEILGVVKDYHHMSLKEEIMPMIFLPSQATGYFSMVVSSDQMKGNLESIKTIYEEIFPGNPFAYFFIDERYATQYQQEQQLGQAFLVGGIIAILISCMGLFALAAYTVQQKSKEIGIRKVLGASSQSLIQLVSKDFVILVGIALVLAFPISWWALGAWQSGFPYKAGISISTFLLAGGLTLLIALLTVGSQALKAAWANPVDSIKDE
ncbi:putative ABC transport system permease protein [Aquiflexum balticum DSM 16537]|uniref:Putative ABC transport system permease protein n=1 Tax=Aquiflexum balticum DSM 16537 TaxID=758820 RepID=A0A1W2H577_9BACT|nr:ABC transporter permease [Aquiflexum balticum]SMD43924.1 putative ABC transport system permease protein [Aquiflexum balticum DSM 16537]